MLTQSASGLQWSTDRVTSARALQQWQEVVWTSLVELEIQSPVTQFNAQINQWGLGPLSINDIAAAPQVVHRTRSCIDKSRREPAFDLIQVCDGHLSFEQAGRSGVLNALDCVLLDESRPYRFISNEAKCLVISIPARWLARWAADPNVVCARKIDGCIGWGHALSTLMYHLRADGVDCLSVAPSVVADQIGAMLMIAGGPIDHDGPRRHQRLIVERARSHMRDFAHDPKVDPGSIAASLGISKRYLHLLFAGEKTSFSRELLEMRLQQARQMFANPQFRNVSIREIAYRSGFVDQGHMTKRFRRRFGLAPRKFRETVPP